jgi:hypothetical protein
VALVYKTLDGDLSDVGTFSLDLPALANAGVVAAREKDGEIVVDVRIVKEPGGSYWLTGGKNRVRLA